MFVRLFNINGIDLAQTKVGQNLFKTTRQKSWIYNEGDFIL
jgi:hypothetical protein